MLPRAHRLTEKRDFERASRGRPVNVAHLTIRAVPNNRRSTRVGVVVGLKISKRATVRNLVKRRLREVFHRHLASIRPGADIVVHVRPSIVGVSYAELASEAGSALHRYQLLAGPWVDTLGSKRSTT